MTAWNKDLWILDAIACRYIDPKENGEIWRRTSLAFGPGGQVRVGAEIRLVKVQTHKATGRVYFNLCWRENPGSTVKVTKSVLVNRVVALKFIPNPLNLPMVNHIDGEKQNNAWKMPDGTLQLEWSTGRDNEIHAHRNGLKTGRGSMNANAKLLAADVLAIRASADPLPVLMERYDVGRTTIVNIQKRSTWVHI